MLQRPVAERSLARGGTSWQAARLLGRIPNFEVVFEPFVIVGLAKSNRYGGDVRVQTDGLHIGLIICYFYVRVLCMQGHQ